MTNLCDDNQGSTVPPLSVEQIRILRAWCEREPEVDTAWIYGSRIRGQRRVWKTTPPDIDLAIAFSQDNPAQRSVAASRASLARLKESLKAHLAHYPTLFGSINDDANFVELRIACEGSQVQGYLDDEQSSVCMLFSRRRPIRWQQEQ